MQKSWDAAIPGVPVWQECLRVLKPGGHLLAFGGTRTYHRLACNIEDAGFEIRDQIQWIYSQGFPKGRDVAYDIHQRAEQAAQHDMRFMLKTYLSSPVYTCRECGQVLLTSMQEHRASQSWRTAATSAHEGLQQPSVERWCDFETPERELFRCQICTMSHGILADGAQGWVHNGASISDGSDSRQDIATDGSSASHRPQSSKQQSDEFDAVFLERRAQKIRGFNVALKPANEPIVLARKPLSEKNVAANVLKYGTGAINIDGCRVATEGKDKEKHLAEWNRMQSQQNGSVKFEGLHVVDLSVYAKDGRFPANVIHDGSEEVASCFPNDSQRFFYGAKCSKSDRGEGNHHPTVKPTSLMQYLCRLITPPGGKVLDPFMGSGSTGKAALAEGFSFVGIEMEEAYFEIAKQRISKGDL